MRVLRERQRERERERGGGGGETNIYLGDSNRICNSYIHIYIDI